MQDKQSSELVKLAVALLDFCLVTLAFYTAYNLRFDSFNDVERYIWLYYFSAPLIIFILLRYSVLTGYRFQSLGVIIVSTLRALIVAGVISSAVLFLSKSGYFSRMLFGYYFMLSALFVLTEKLLLKQLYKRHLRRGGMSLRIAMVGYGEKFEEIVGDIREHPEWGIRPVLFFDPQVMDVASVAGRIREAVVDEIFVIYPRGAIYHQQIDDLLMRLEKLGLPVRVTLNFDEFQDYYSQHSCRVGARQGVLLAPHKLDPDQLILKRMMDLFGGIFGVLITAVLTPFIGLAIKLESPGPIFFSHTRIGKGGREFTIYKFRSMYRGAERQQAELAEQNIHRGPLFKVKDDPRVTRVGRFLRKYSVDEFPQFLNVLKGDMSLVGTRPPTREEVAEYQDHHFRRISAKPGLTGLWQVEGRNQVRDFDEVVAQDVKYIKSWSLLMDIKIMLRTVRIVIYPGDNGGM